MVAPIRDPMELRGVELDHRSSAGIDTSWALKVCHSGWCQGLIGCSHEAFFVDAVDGVVYFPSFSKTVRRRSTDAVDGEFGGSQLPVDGVVYRRRCSVNCRAQVYGRSAYIFVTCNLPYRQGNSPPFGAKS